MAQPASAVATNGPLSHEPPIPSVNEEAWMATAGAELGKGQAVLDLLVSFVGGSGLCFGFTPGPTDPDWEANENGVWVEVPGYGPTGFDDPSVAGGVGQGVWLVGYQLRGHCPQTTPPHVPSDSPADLETDKPTDPREAIA